MSTQDKIVKIFNNANQDVSYEKIIEIGRKTPLNIKIEKHRGTYMRWNKNVIARFDYGDVVDMVNQVDNMGWDIIIVPSSSAKDTNLLIVGVVEVKPDADAIPFPEGNIPGNHKLLLAQDGKINQNDIDHLTYYFSTTKPFLPPKFF